ncbi:hypothetical protein ACWEV3_38370 [Saccharopolyspora sp. NPDC003752]
MVGVEHPYAATVDALELLRARWSAEEKQTPDAAHAAVLRGRLFELDEALARLIAYELFHLWQEHEFHRTPERSAIRPVQPSQFASPRQTPRRSPPGGTTVPPRNDQLEPVSMASRRIAETSISQAE